MDAVVAQPAVRAGVRPLRIRRYDRDLRADVLSVVGYLAECPCGYRGKVRRSVTFARRDLTEHLDSEHDGNQTKGGNERAD